ncbi:MAG TPA: phospho-N-acetylmuramoyl-pentapeptide-transferase [Acidimicrobiales bacterium]|nr:phospho-N-acetylmuramoyl-pentapeptide-transferase [Acidimicrobiales bacterium]
MLSLMEAGGAALFLAIVFTPMLIRFQRRRDIGQQIREDGPASHVVKAGTPTMGGILIVLAGLLGYLVGHLGGYRTFTRSGVLVLALVVACGLIGFADDLVGVRNTRNLGLNKRTKFAAQVLVAIGFAIAAWKWAGATTTISFTRYDLPGWHVGPVVWIAFAAFVVVATSNAVNLTDGLDGLAAGSSTFCFSVLAVIGYWQFRHYPIYRVGTTQATALDLGLVAVALVGGCLGFLWWNAAPARIIMGDTGALSIGAGLAGLCLLMNLDLLLVVIGGLFVIETLSVIAQVISFRVFHRRVLRIAPIHHHFEMLGWPETTVLIRFWILAGLFAALGLGLFYGDFVKIAKVL